MEHPAAPTRRARPQREERPEGFLYREEFITADEEERLRSVLSAIDFRAVVMRGQAARRTVRHFGLAPRSAYLLTGKARWSWQHCVPATKALRYSMTFRTLKRSR